MLWKAANYTIYSDSIVQGNFFAKALSANELTSNYRSPANEYKRPAISFKDLIRFGKFLQPFHEKNYTSEPKYLVFPIPNQQLFVNENLSQNPGNGK